MNWDEWRGSLDGRPTMHIRRLAKVRGRRADLHKFVRPDDPGCFHTHPAPAIRVVLWGGYVEELEDGRLVTWQPGDFGLVRPELCHRVHSLLNGKVSYSLWLRGQVCADVALRGPGWPKPELKSIPVRYLLEDEVGEASRFSKEDADLLKAILQQTDRFRNSNPPEDTQ